MKKLPNINLTRKEYELYLYGNDIFNRGSEGHIYQLDNCGTFRKIFCDEYLLDSIYENKLSKLSLLYQISDFENDVKIRNSLSCEGKLVGYDMVSSTILSSYSEFSFLPKVQIEILQKIKEKLEIFHRLDIVYGDIKQDNILVNPNTLDISFCDLDNIQIQDKPIDFYNMYVSIFEKNNGLFSENVDRYMFNLLYFSEYYFPKTSYYDIINDMACGIDLDEFSENQKQTMKEMKKTLTRKNVIFTQYYGDYFI